MVEMVTFMLCISYHKKILGEKFKMNENHLKIVSLWGYSETETRVTVLIQV